MNHAALIEYLVALGDDVNHPDQEGSTPLMTAIVYGAREAAAVLLRRGGASYAAVDGKGMGVLHCLARLAGVEVLAAFVGLAEEEEKEAQAGAGGLLAGLGRNVTDDGDGEELRAVLERRPDASAELRGWFGRLLDVLSGPATDDVQVEEDEDDEFYDAVESH